MESILTSIKKIIGISEEYEHFDPDIIMHINSVFVDLNLLGVGPETVFSISDKSQMWSDFLENEGIIQKVKPFMAHKVKLAFDNSTMSSASIEALQRIIDKDEWLLNVAVDPRRKDDGE